MAKKYLTLEEAAAMAGIDVTELNRLREQRQVRGFADRGTWKFKQEDIEELIRSRQTDSAPEFPLLSDDEPLAAGGSSVLNAGDDELPVDEQPTVIRGSALEDDEPLGGGVSDSNVRLILDDDLAAASSGDSDSDVRLIGDSGPSLLDRGSESDVKLLGTDPEIPLLAGGSDSDVRLVSPEDTRRATSESDIRLAPADDRAEPLAAGAPGSGSVFGDDDADIGLAAESGISLESLADSGISLESADSGIALGSADSGISLGGLADSGISLADEDDDSITLAKEPPKKPAGKKPAAKRPADDELEDTHLEVPAAEDSEFELAMDDDDQADTSVILFDDDDELDQHSATVVKKGRREELDLVEEEESFDLEAATGEFEVEEDEAVVAAEDVVGEDDELDFVEAGDEDFDDEFVSGHSQAEFVAPAGRVAAPVEQDWGTGTFIGLIAATALLAVCGAVTFDLVRTMWTWGDPNGLNSALLDTLRGFF